MTFFEHSPIPRLSELVPESFIAAVLPMMIDAFPVAPGTAKPEQVRLLMMHMLVGHGVDNAAEAMTAAVVIAAQAAAVTAFGQAKKEGLEEKQVKQWLTLGNSLTRRASSTQHQLQRMQARRKKEDEEFARQHGHGRGRMYWPVTDDPDEIPQPLPQSYVPRLVFPPELLQEAAEYAKRHPDRARAIRACEGMPPKPDFPKPRDELIRALVFGPDRHPVSCPDLVRAPTSSPPATKQDVDTRAKPAHDTEASAHPAHDTEASAQPAHDTEASAQPAHDTNHAAPARDSADRTGASSRAEPHAPSGQEPVSEQSREPPHAPSAPPDDDSTPLNSVGDPPYDPDNPGPAYYAREARWYATIYPDRAALILKHRGIPPSAKFGPPEDELIAAILASDAPEIRALAAQESPHAT